MATFARVAVMMAAMIGLVAAGPYYPKAWVDLFQPPYQNCPEIMMSIGCLSRDHCVVPGGSNGVGFAVYKFDGQWNGNFTPFHQIDGIEIDFLLQTGVGGKTNAPKGAVGGAGLLFGLKYFVNDSFIAPSVTTPFTETMDIRTDSTGMKVLLINGMSAKPTALYSTDGAETFTSSDINTNVTNPKCTIASYQSLTDVDGTWFMAAGSFPEAKKKHHNGGDNVKMVNEWTAILKKGANMDEVRADGWIQNKKNPNYLRRSMLKLNQEWIAAGKPKDDGPKCNYTAALLKTTDFGKTYTTYNFNETYWSFNDIDCANASFCMAVASGFKQEPGARVFQTTDGGNTWKESLFLPSEAGAAIYALNSIRHNPANKNEFWVAGGLETQQGNQAIFYYTEDGGAHWKPHGAVNFVAEVIQMSFTPDGTGFAVGITQFDDSTIMRYTWDGPAYTPAPAWNGNFTQKQCADNACSVNCTELSLPQNTCLNLTGGGSAKATCDMTDQVLIQDMFPLDDTCWGPYAPQPQPIGVCIEAGGGGSFMNICGPTTGSSRTDGQVMRPKKGYTYKKH